MDDGGGARVQVGEPRCKLARQKQLIVIGPPAGVAQLEGCLHRPSVAQLHHEHEAIRLRLDGPAVGACDVRVRG